MPRSRGNGGVVGTVIIPGTSGVVSSQEATQFVLSGEWPGSTYAAAVVSSNQPTITSIIVTDSGYNNVSANLTVSNSYIKIFGTNFQANSNVFVQNVAVSSANVTFTNSTELRVALPRLDIDGTNLSLLVTNQNFYQSNTYIDPQFRLEYLVVAGGGGGGSLGGGGGAGGLLTGNVINLSETTYTITVGSGGSGAVDHPVRGTNGANSSIVGVISTLGGGAGGSWSLSAGQSGGSGGGAAGTTTSHVGGSGTEGPPRQGFAGGNASGSSVAGGGGAGAAALNTTSGSGSGGIGIENSITGTSIYYAGGGGAGAWQGAYAAGSGGLGGGATSTAWNGAQSGTNNTGGGGSGGGFNGSSIFAPGGDGGSGVVIIRYDNRFSEALTTTGSPTVTTSGGYRIYKFTSSGTITLPAQ